MSDKSEIEAIRAVKRYDVNDDTLWWSPGTTVVLARDYDRMLSHVDALEARVAQALEDMHTWHRMCHPTNTVTNCIVCQANLAALAGSKP